MGIFKKKSKAIKASPPEEKESPGEIKHIEELSEKTPAKVEQKYEEVPRCVSKEQVWNLIIENNIMLKQIMEEI